MYISPEQLRAARAILNLKQSDLADSVGIERKIIGDYENEKKTLQAKTMSKLASFFDSKIVFIEGGAYKKPKESIRILRGKHGFSEFMNDVYRTVELHGGEVLVSNVDEANWIKWMGVDEYDHHKQRMQKVQNDYNFKIVICEGDDFYIASSIAEYRKIPKEFFSDQSFYVYGEKLALIAFSHDDVTINIIEGKHWADAQRAQFNLIWSQANTIEKIL